MIYSSVLRKNIENSIRIKENFLLDRNNFKNFEKITSKILKSYLNKGKIYIMGNGGSAADAQHFTAELISKFKRKRKSINIECLNTNVSTITSIANDYNFKYIFSKQLESSITKNDILFAISTSGNSLNILEALKFAKKNRIYSFLLSGKDGGKAKKLSNSYILVPSISTAIIQEVHIIIEHSLAEIIESKVAE